MTENSMNFNDVAIINVGRNKYWIHIWGITKCKAMNKIIKC